MLQHGEMPAKAFHLTKWNRFIKLIQPRDAIILVAENDDNTADVLESWRFGGKRRCQMKGWMEFSWVEFGCGSGFVCARASRFYTGGPSLFPHCSVSFHTGEMSVKTTCFHLKPQESCRVVGHKLHTILLHSGNSGVFLWDALVKMDQQCLHLSVNAPVNGAHQATMTEESSTSCHCPAFETVVCVWLSYDCCMQSCSHTLTHLKPECD